MAERPGRRKGREVSKGPRLTSNPRATAARILSQVAGGRSYSHMLNQQLTQSPPEQRPLIQELCYGVLRWQPRLNALSAQLIDRPLKPRDGDIHALILLGCYQLTHMRVAPHAAVTETVEAAKVLGKTWAAGLINGVLRRFQREQESLLAALDQNPISHYAHPAWLLKALQAAWPDHWQAILAAANQRPPMSLRINQLQIQCADYAILLANHGISSAAIPYLPTGLVLERPLDVMELPGFSEGHVSVQDGGAQLAAGLLDLQAGQRVLDACAAPGGKSCHILETEPGLASLTAIDADAGRLRRVEENLQRLKLEAEVCVGDASNPTGDWAQRRYDRILLDVPCSATGVIRRHPDIKMLRSPEDRPALAELQSRILDAVWPLLTPGGILLYSTCSLLPEENERQIEQFLLRQHDAHEQSLEGPWGHARIHGRQTLPGEQTMDGFYYARMEKAT